MKKHKSVILFSEWKKPLQALSLEQKGRILDALLDFPEGIQPDFEDPLLLMAWAFMQGGLEENARKWEEIRERRAEAGRKGNEKRWHSDNHNSKNRKCDTCDDSIANVADSVSDSGSVSASGSVSGSAKEIESSSSSDSICDDQTTSPEDYFRKSIGKLTDKSRKELSAYADRMGEELVRAVITKCADLGAHSWAYVRKALAEAEAQGCTSADEYRMTNPIGGSRAKGTHVSREAPAANDWLKDAARRRPMKATDEEERRTECLDTKSLWSATGHAVRRLSPTASGPQAPVPPHSMPAKSRASTTLSIRIFRQREWRF